MKQKQLETTEVSILLGLLSSSPFGDPVREEVRQTMTSILRIARQAYGLLAREEQSLLTDQMQKIVGPLTYRMLDLLEGAAGKELLAQGSGQESQS